MLEQYDSKNPCNRWAIIGGGLLGLTAALELRKRGQEVTLFEASPDLGGLASAWKIGDAEWDRFYHVISLSDNALRTLLKELDLEEGIEWVSTRTGFYSKGKFYSLTTSIDFLKFPVLNLIEKFRLASTIMLASRVRDWKRLEKITVESWLRKWSGQSTFDKVWLPLLRAKLGDAYRRTSAAFIWAYIDRMYKARRSGMKREMFGYVPGGYSKILSGLRRKLIAEGVTIETNSPVEKINRLDGGDGFEVHVAGNCRCKFDFDRVVVTLPAKAIKKICPQLSGEEVAKLDAIEYLGVVCTSMLLKRPLAGYYVTNILDTWVPFTGIIEMGSILPPEKLGGHYLVYLPTYMLSTDERLLESDETIHERCISTLEKMYPDFDRSQVAAIQTARAKQVMAIPTLNYSENLPPLKSSLSGLYLLNSARIVKGTLNVNETIELMHEELNSTVWPDHLSRATCGNT